MTELPFTAKDFAPHVLAVLGELSNLDPTVGVPMEDTYEPVCKRMGLDAQAYGLAPGKGSLLLVYRKIQLAWRGLRDKDLASNPTRGHWGLTEEGLEALKAENGVSESPKDAEDAPVTAEPDPEPSKESTMPVLPETSSETATQNKVVPLAPPPAHPYSDDPYIRRLAIERVSCLGAFSRRSEICKQCNISLDCIAAVDLRKTEIAKDILREKAEAEARERARVAAKARKDASIDELIELHDNRSGGSKKATTQAAKEGLYTPAKNVGVIRATTERDTECHQCGHAISEKKEGLWIRHVGFFHEHCMDLSDHPNVSSMDP